MHCSSGIPDPLAQSNRPADLPGGLDSKRFSHQSKIQLLKSRLRMDHDVLSQRSTTIN